MEFSEEINKPSTLTEDWNNPLTEEWVNSEYGQNLLTQLQAKIIDPESDVFWTSWHKLAADGFLNPSGNGYLNLSQHLDVHHGYKSYSKWKRENPEQESTFFGFLLWHLIKTLKRPERVFKAFHFRKIATNWYIINNPTIIIPVFMLSGDDIKDAIIPNVYQIETLSQWMDIYIQTVKQTRSGSTHRVSPYIYSLSHLFGNLPNQPFESFHLHWFPGTWVGNISLYFGKRYFPGTRFFPELIETVETIEENKYSLNHLLLNLLKSGFIKKYALRDLLQGRLQIPCSIKFFHGTLNPGDIDLFLEEFLKSLNCLE